MATVAERSTTMFTGRISSPCQPPIDGCSRSHRRRSRQLSELKWNLLETLASAEEKEQQRADFSSDEAMVEVNRLQQQLWETTKVRESSAQNCEAGSPASVTLLDLPLSAVPPVTEERRPEA